MRANSEILPANSGPCMMRPKKKCGEKFSIRWQGSIIESPYKNFLKGVLLALFVQPLKLPLLMIWVTCRASSCVTMLGTRTASPGIDDSLTSFRVA